MIMIRHEIYMTYSVNSLAYFLLNHRIHMPKSPIGKGNTKGLQYFRFLFRLRLADRQSAFESQIPADRQSRSSRTTCVWQTLSGIRSWNLCLMTKIAIILTISDPHDAYKNVFCPRMRLKPATSKTWTLAKTQTTCAIVVFKDTDVVNA